jgi:ubiquinone/menaquinone biosynthesis C-methylase UbiE
LPNTEYDPTAWSRIPEYAEDMANDLFHQPCHLLPTILGFTKPDDSVLEVGCGGQGYANQFRLLKMNYVGLDITPEYLEIARAKFPEFKFVEGDARKMPFEDQSFGVSFSNNLLLHLTPEDAVSVVREMLRVSKRAVVVVSRFADEDKMDTQISSYPEKDGTFTEFLYNTLSYERFQFPGWVTYCAPSSLLLVSVNNNVQVAMLELQQEYRGGQ